VEGMSRALIPPMPVDLVDIRTKNSNHEKFHKSRITQPLQPTDASRVFRCAIELTLDLEAIEELHGWVSETSTSEISHHIIDAIHD
jgi:hypothetical protein